MSSFIYNNNYIKGQRRVGLRTSNSNTFT